ncbi:DUF2971 domain-containing protein [Rhizobium sp. P44RR-XXIV]|uniref:DUF2971 domain-containing protein n=1 Tax=Rhizobium sp. P44RR-XXIV TaxID=1921145 RepID=UPI0009CFB0E3|nr:DUF2971 domain-containing protein [Rhizobium sp. P44RR-XXIV]
MHDDDELLRAIFMPLETEYMRRSVFAHHRLAHYTTAENAVNILKGQQIWLRNARVMNDTQEVNHGISMIQRAIRPAIESTIEPALRQLAQALDQAYPGIAQECFALFDQFAWSLQHKTYVTCLSLHDPKERNGRLSMWRAYTGNHAGVALIINPEPFVQFIEDPSFFSTPVAYLSDEQLMDRLTTTAEYVGSQTELISRAGRDKIRWFFGYLLRYVATSSKHPGFAEEQEWRVMHTEGLDPENGLLKEVEKIGGIPQLVAKLRLEPNNPYADKGITIPNLLESVIVGPTNYPTVVANALQRAMEEAGISDADKKIRISDIPMRMSS